MERIAHGIVNGAHIVGDVVVERPNIGSRHGDVVREAPIAIYADDLGVGADVGVAGAAEHTPAIDDVAFCRHPIADVNRGHQAPDLLDIAGELVAHDEWRFQSAAGPLVPRIDVDVGAADSSATNPDQDLVLSDRRLGDLHEIQPGTSRSLHQRSHARHTPEQGIRLAPGSRRTSKTRTKREAGPAIRRPAALVRSRSSVPGTYIVGPRQPTNSFIARGASSQMFNIMYCNAFWCVLYSRNGHLSCIGLHWHFPARSHSQ